MRLPYCAKTHVLYSLSSLSLYILLYYCILCVAVRAAARERDTLRAQLGRKNKIKNHFQFDPSRITVGIIMTIYLFILERLFAHDDGSGTAFDVIGTVQRNAAAASSRNTVIATQICVYRVVQNLPYSHFFV